MRILLRTLISVLLFARIGWAQGFFVSAYNPLPISTVQLPTVWVDGREWYSAQNNPTHTINFPLSGSGGSWTCHATNYGPYTADSVGSCSQFQQSINDAETCRTNNLNDSFLINKPAGSTESCANGITLPQTANDTSTQFIVINTTTPFTLGVTVGSHGIQDNTTWATQPGLRNPGLTGANMSYQLGTGIYTVPTGAFTFANGTLVNTSQYNDVASMWEIIATGANQNAISTASWDSNLVGPHHYAIVGANIHPAAGLTSVSAPFSVGQNTETQLSQIPKHIHLVYSYIHGDWAGDAPMTGCPSACVATAAPTGTNSLPFLYVGNACIYCSVAYNYFDGNLRPGAEGHGIGLLMVQQMKFVHNYMDNGGSIGKICGGAGNSITFANFITCQYEEDRGNNYCYPYSYSLAFQGTFVPGAGNYVRKNAHEYKFGQYVLEDGNIYCNVDTSGSQNGTDFSHKTAQNSGGGAGSNYWTLLQHVTVSNIVARNSCNGPSFGDRSSAVGNGGGVSLPTQYIAFSNILAYNASVSGPGCNVTIGVTHFSSSPQYGLRNGQNVPAATWAATAQRDSAGLTTTLTLTSVAGQTVSDQSVGDPVTVTGCTDTTFNVGNTVMGPPALAGTLVNGLTVVYSNPGTANSSTSGCTFSNAQGWPNHLSCVHCTIISDIGSGFSPYDSALGGANIFPMARNIDYHYDIFVNGGLASARGKGTAVSTTDYDPSTFNFNNSFLGGQTPSLYTEYGGAHAGASPPVTLYLTPTAYCTGNDPTTGTCLGVLAAMSTSTFPISVNDYTQFRLCHGDAACNNKWSLYAAGQVNQALDGTDLGVDFLNLNLAQTRKQYVCPSYCGPGGPYPDY